MTAPTVATSTPATEAQRIDAFLKANLSFLGPDPEIQNNHHISERSSREEEVLNQGLDPHLFAEMRARFQAALDETFNIAEQTVATPAAQCGDMSTAFFTAAGDASQVSSRGVAAFAVSLHYPIRFIRKYFENDPTVGVREGDAFLMNDCHYGGVHSPDQHMFMPVFHGGELIAWVCCAMHEGEIGAKSPGGMGPTIESPWDEGFRGSPIKIVEGYRLKTDLVTLVQNSSREPQVMMADLKSRLAACKRLERRMQEAVEAHGVAAVIGFFRGNVEYMRDEARRRIAELPDGTIRVNFYCDETMREPALLKIKCQFTIKGDRLILDLRGSAPELYNRPINSLRSTITIAVITAFSHHVWPDMPAAQALADNMDVLTDPNSIVDASSQVPVALCMQPLFKVITATEIAFSKLYYGAPKRYARVKAGWFNQPQSIIYGGINQHMDSVGNMCGDLNGMAGGARCDMDGEHSMSPNFGAYCDIGEGEEAEETLPFVRMISKRLYPDNCGFGKYRGGAAYQYGLMRFGNLPFGFQTFTGGSYFPSTMGIFGGYACPVYAVCTIRGKNLFADMKADPTLFRASIEYLMNEQPFKGATYTARSMAVPFDFYSEGELFMVSQGAGGGYGDVLERDPALIVKDLEDGIVSHHTARELYGLAYDEVSLALDLPGTLAARAAQREARKQRGMTWHDFVATRVKPEPPAGSMYFGEWNGSAELYAGPYGKGLPGQLPPLFLPDPQMVENAQLKARIAELESSLAQK